MTSEQRDIDNFAVEYGN